MDEQRQLLFVNQFLPSNEQKLIDRFQDAATRRATRPPEVTMALRNMPVDTISDVVIGPNNIGILYTDGQIGRFPYVATTRQLAPSASPSKSTTTPSAAAATSDTSGGASGGSGGGGGSSGGPPTIPPGGGSSSATAHSSLISRTTKMRRVLMSTSAVRRDHGRSVIIDRARPMVPASSVPEDAIAQAQVVLQGKSREVIVRELQRTNLNVNEAVNNLLSRDDDDDDGSEGADVVIPEELLSLLDSSHGVLESDLYPPDSFEYLLSNRDRRNKSEKDKEKQKSSKPVIESNSATEALKRYEIPTGSISEPWEGLECKNVVLEGPPRFSHICCTQSELLAIGRDDNKIYGWPWHESTGQMHHHKINKTLNLEKGEKITHISACSLRVAIMTSSGRIASWVDEHSCGIRLSQALLVPLQKLNTNDPVEQLVVSNHLAVARLPNNVFFWCGVYPVNDRRRIFEKARNKQRKHVTFDTTQIVIGSEVRTKSAPIYSIGSIATNLAGPKPMMGILMENAWSLSEVCRFRLLEPSMYDKDYYTPSSKSAPVPVDEAESRETAIGQQALTAGSRKRAAASEVFADDSAKHREEPWPISDVIFIHEEVQNDTAIVTIVDGGYCAVVYKDTAKSPTDKYATKTSKALASKGEKDKPQQKARLIRKDELTVVSQKMRYARSPNSIRVEPYRFVLSGSTATKRVISVVADSLGIRALVERRGAASIMRISVCGKTLTAHSLPLHAPSLHDMYGESGKGPTLMNYGDDSILLLRDAYGGLIPLIRDAAAGFREPTYLQLPASSITALAVKNVKEKDRPSWAPKANREAIILSLQGTQSRAQDRLLPSLMYTVMACDEKAVKALLDALQKEEDLELSRQEIIEARADGNRNVLHAAVMNAFATKNALEADVENPMSVLTTSESRSSAEQVRAALDKKWNEMLKTRSSHRSATGSGSASSIASSNGATVGTDSTQPTAPSASREEVLNAGVSIKIEMDENYVDDNAPLPQIVRPSPVENPKQRQENAIAIVKMLVTHPICMPFMADLLGGRDILGQTPFMAAVNHKAYSAARYILKAVKSLFVDGDRGRFNPSMSELLLPFIFPPGSRPDDSPLFILCYNDTCSFTWTGDEHINQDIFECKTCGLTGSLCCCTECAFTCHRNHDCKLKRTSPTAYCDCWEKACCKALVAGNQHARESLLVELIGKSNLYTMLNGRGEHILLYLARKLARQSAEQWNYTRRPRRIQPPTSARDGLIPEHDLDPPKFARTALMYCLRNWSVIKSLAMIGVRELDHSMPMAEEIFHLNAQHGSSHLDKFMLILFTKCSDESTIVLESLLRVLTETHNNARIRGGTFDIPTLEEVNFVISRFVRSVARLYILAVVISNVAASTAVSGLAPVKDSSSSVFGSSLLDRGSIRGITFSGIFGHLRKEGGPSKDSKAKNMGMFIVRCKVFFEHFAVFTLHEMAQLADASLAPVRTGILRPCVSLAALLGSNADSIENLEKYINSEPDVTQLMGKAERGEEGGGQREGRKEAKRRRKRSSRRDTDREEAPSESQGETGAAAGGAVAAAERGTGTDRAAPRVAPDSSDSESDSDSDGDGPSSRRIASQSSALAAQENEETSANEQAARDDFDSSEDEEVESESDGDRREDDEDEEEEEMEKDGEGGEEEDADMDLDATSEPSAVTGDEESRGETTRRSTGSRTRRSRPPHASIIIEDNSDEDNSEYSGHDSFLDGPLSDGNMTDGEGSRSASSPEYSSLSEGEEHQRGAGRASGGRRERRRKKAVAAADAADAAAAAAARVAVDGEAHSEQGEEASVDVGEPAARGEQRDEGEEDVDMREEAEEDEDDQSNYPMDDNERAALEEREDVREGSARTRPAVVAGGASATGDGAEENREAAAETATVGILRNRDRQVARRGGITGRRGARATGAAGEDRLSSRRNATADASRATRTEGSERGGSTGGWSYRRHQLPPWISRTIGGDESRRAARGATTTTSAGGGESSSSSEEKKPEVVGLNEDETPTALKAAIQLAAAFSFAVRVIGDLLPVVAEGASRLPPSARISSFREIEQLKKIEEAVRKRAIDHVSTRLEDSWRWLAVVLDHTEAQIKYINAVTTTEEAMKKESKEKKKGQRREQGNDGGESSTAAAANIATQSAARAKRETMACILGILRAHSGEAGDDTPLVDLETLRAPALVVDAYLGFIEAKADAEKLFEQDTQKNTRSAVERDSASPDKRGEEEIVGVRRFYQRSNSVSFPGASFTDAHDTLQLSCMQSLPIVERPQLLTSTVEKEVIFGPPPSTQERTKEEHDKVIRSHGVSHPHNQSLTAAPIAFHRLFVEGETTETDHAVNPLQPVVIPSVASAPANMNEMVKEEEEEEKVKEKKKPTPQKSKRGRKRGVKGDLRQSSKPPHSPEEVAMDEDDERSKAPTSPSADSAVVVQQEPPVGFEKVTYEEILETFKIFREHPLRKLMGRWRFTLQLIAKELHGDLTDTLGGDLSGSRLLRELAGFEMKQHELRARMEKYRATATKDVSIEVHREPAALIRETCYQLNRTFTRRMAMRGTESRASTSALNPKKDDPLPVKVKFTDEPGEGTGVARSYYTALAEALASQQELPFTDYGYTAGNDEYLYGGPIPPGSSAPSSSAATAHASSGRRIQLIRGRDSFYATVSASSSAAGARRRVSPFERRLPLNYLHPPYTPADMAAAEALNVSPDFLLELREETYARRESTDKLPTELTDRLFILIRNIHPTAAARLTGMFMDLPLSHIILVLGDSSALRAYLGDAIDQMMTTAAPTDIALLRGEDERKELLAASVTTTEADDAPLFFRPSKKAHYSPVPGRLSPARMNAFRNVGRVMGLCLMQCEMFPLRLSRHVLKYILGRPLNWHDFAFYDPQMFESLRKLIVEGCSAPDHRQFFDDLQMTFSIDMPPEATGMPSSTMDLIPGGSDILVTKENIIEYVYRFVEARLLGTTNGRCLAAIRQGVQDVIPQSMLDNLTAEDLRLVLCGTETVSLSLMQSYTAWTDESHAAPETIDKFKQWFWQVADRLSPQEKQDLIFFWTGAPSLPSTEEGFQPLPTIVIRPTDDGFLPTANTCISRLYLPLYNSKKTLIAKLQLAIKAKNFGFV